jgi:dephospho-CoA kinase
LIRIAITGQIGSGKSTVLKEFKRHGAFALDADQIVHELLSSSPTIIEEIKQKFGDRVLRNGMLCRKKIAEIVFSNDNTLKVLEDIIHPAVKKTILSSYEHLSPSVPFFVVELPLLNRSGLSDWFDMTLLVEAPSLLRRKRWCQRGNDLHQFTLRNQRQKNSLPKDFDITLLNIGSEEELKNQVTRIINNITKETPRQ